MGYRLSVSRLIGFAISAGGVTWVAVSLVGTGCTTASPAEQQAACGKTFKTDGKPNALAKGDFDGDGNDDLVIATDKNLKVYYGGSVDGGVPEAGSATGFKLVAPIPVGIPAGGTLAVAAGNIMGSAHPEIVYGTKEGVVILPNQDGKSFGEPIRLPTAGEVVALSTIIDHGASPAGHTHLGVVATTQGVYQLRRTDPTLFALLQLWRGSLDRQATWIGWYDVEGYFSTFHVRTGPKGFGSGMFSVLTANAAPPIAGKLLDIDYALSSRSYSNFQVPGSGFVATFGDQLRILGTEDQRAEVSLNPGDFASTAWAEGGKLAAAVGNKILILTATSDPRVKAKPSSVVTVASSAANANIVALTFADAATNRVWALDQANETIELACQEVAFATSDAAVDIRQPDLPDAVPDDATNDARPNSDGAVDSGSDGTTDASADAGGDASLALDGSSDATGPVCKSASFDGTGATGLKAPDHASYDFAGSFTIEAWIKVEGTPASNRALIAGQTTDDMTLSLSSYWLAIDSNLAPLFSLSNGNNNTNTAGTPLSQNVWTHIAGVFDGTNATLYVNGAQAHQLPASAVAVGDGLRIGHTKANFAQNFQFHGKIKDVRLSNNARYTSTFTPQSSLSTDANTVGLFHLDSSGGVSTDSSATANNAVVTGTLPLASDCPP